MRKRSQRKNRHHSRLGLENLETRTLLAADLASLATDMAPAEFDINEDGFVAPIDAMMVMNGMAEDSAVDSRDPDRVKLDTNRDGRLTPLDALRVVNNIGRRTDRPNDRPSNQPSNDSAKNRDHSPRMDDADRGEVDSDSDVVLDWNNVFDELLVANEENQNPGYASRAMAMLNVAIYDAVTVASGYADDTFYEYEDIGQVDNVSAEVAASEAAYTVLSALYPEQQSIIDAARDEVGFGRRDGRHQSNASVELGAQIGNGVLEARANDGSDAVVDYIYEEGVGSFQADPLNPDVPVWGPGWGEVTPFVIDSAESFAPDSTPPIDSAEYAESYEEVKELGSVESTTRTADETEAGIFWAYDRLGLGTPMALFGDILETVAVDQGNSLEENAALFAQASVAMADAGIVAWHTKFSEEFWRPVTAIQDGDFDGNPLTEGDTDWTALGAPDGGDDVIGFTPQFPTYISGHATFGGALFGALQEFYGTDDISFDVTSQELEILLDAPELQEAYGLELDDAVRTFDSFSEAMAENGRSRVYLGIHFDFDDTVGQEVGQAVAQTVSSEFVVSNDGSSIENDRRGFEANGRSR